MHIDIDALVVAVINDHKTRDIARHSLGGGAQPSQTKCQPPKRSLPILIFLCESARKCIISYQIPQKFSVGGAQPLARSHPNWREVHPLPRTYPLGTLTPSVLGPPTVKILATSLHKTAHKHSNITPFQAYHNTKSVQLQGVLHPNPLTRGSAPGLQ